MMSGIEIQVNADDVQQAVVQALMESTVGETISEQIKKHFTGYNADTFWRGVVACEIERVAALAVAKEIESHADEIRERVASSINQEVIGVIVKKVIHQLWDERR